jgi:predicted HTH domain antitoxin
MDTVQVELPAELVRTANLDARNVSQEAARLIALELFREGRVSLGRAAKLCRTGLAEFREFAGRHEVSPIRYGEEDLEQDRRTLRELGL